MLQIRGMFIKIYEQWILKFFELYIEFPCLEMPWSLILIVLQMDYKLLYTLFVAKSLLLTERFITNLTNAVHKTRNYD